MVEPVGDFNNSVCLSLSLSLSAARGEKINTVLSVVTSIDLLHYISSQQKLQ